MIREKCLALALALALLTGCEPPGPAPTPTPTAPPSQLTWLHAYYANSSYSQMDLTGALDAVSLGWARLRLDDTGPWVSTTRENGNEWIVPKSSHLVTDALRQQGIPYHLCVYASGAATVTLADGSEVPVLTTAIDPDHAPDTVRALCQAAEDYHGLTIDFEGLRQESSKENFTAFMRLLRQELPAEKGLWVAVPPDRWFPGYDYRALGEICDKVLLMCHDYQWTRAPEENLGTELTDTPIAPIDLVDEALAHFTDPETGVGDLSKAVLALAFSCAGVEVDEAGLLLDTRVYNPGTETLTRRLAQEDAQRGWSELYQAPYVYYHDEEGHRYRVWYEDARSVKAKVELAYQYGIMGLSLWRLGTIPNSPGYDAWSEVLTQRGR